MRRTIFVGIRGFSAIALLVGIVILCVGLADDFGDNHSVTGLVVIIASLFLLGGAYVVEAACIYVSEKNREEDERKENINGTPQTE